MKHEHLSTLNHSQTTSVKLKIFKLGNKYFGRLEETTFHRSVRLSRHLYRTLDGFGVDTWLLKELKNAGCKALCFTEVEEAKVYLISLLDFECYGQVVDHGFNRQMICPRKHWQVKQKPRQMELIRGG